MTTAQARAAMEVADRVAPGRVADAAALHETVLGWYAANARDLAFRRTIDPWAVLVSEVMAQQTQAARAAEAWSTFMGRYQTPAALAAASVAEVIRAWRGLGYNRRAIALHAAAVRIVEEHDGRVPETLDALMALPGIGPYTARAVLAIAFGQPVAALDTNIRRVLDRVVGPLPTSAAGKQEAADGWVPRDRPSEWTHALMDIGATFCRKREPRCDGCPLLASCRFVREMASDPARAASEAPQHQPRPRFEATNRWLRGRILDRLRDAADGAWLAFDGPMGAHDLDSVTRALAALEAERFVERHRTDPTLARLTAA